MAERQDYYETLGVARGAPAEEIRKAYKRLVRKFHPDVNPGDKAAEERFKKIQDAYDTLGDDKKRQMYDQFGHSGDRAAQGGGAGAQYGPGMGFGGFDFDEFMKQAGAGAGAGAGRAGNAGFKGIFDQFFRGFGGGPETRGEAERGGDLEYALNIDFWQSIRGTQSRLRITRQDVCDGCGGGGASGAGTMNCMECNGSGQVSQMAGAMRFNLTCPRCGGRGRSSNKCFRCQGEGRVSRQEEVEVRIPAGAQTGARLRVPGKGNAGSLGGPAGDLYITLRIDEHPFFRRDGDNIEIRVPVAVWEAGLGAKIEVPTIDGRALLKVPQGTQNGQKFRLRDKGVLNARKGTRGDQIIEVQIQLPEVNDERTREILRELASRNPADPRAALWRGL
ncbi:MAG: J domain-containing protein [Acidobacteria bacterium]|nr:J domain-containing protein [Acidobacteriota bacterium]